MSAPETLPADATGPTEPVGQAQDAVDEGRALASLLLALDRPVLQPLAAPVDLGPLQATSTHWETPRASRWRCACATCAALGQRGRRAFQWSQGPRAAGGPGG